MWEYSDKLKDHFLNPRNVGAIENPDGVGEIGNITCGDALRLTLKIDKNTDTISDAKFKTFGCASAIASSSVLTEMVKGKKLDDVLKLTNLDIARELGGLPEEKMHCSVMGQEALEAAIDDYYTKSGKTRSPKQEVKVICTCFGVTDTEIKKVVAENDLTTVDEVTNYCKAGGGCGGCKMEIEELIKEVQGSRAKIEHVVIEKPKKLTNIQKIQLIQQTINDQIRPMLRADGGDIDLIDVDGNNVIVAFRGMCAKCRMSEFTMKDVVEARLREFVSDDLNVTEQKDSHN